MANLIALMHISFDGFAATEKGEMNWISMDENIFIHVSKYIEEIGTGVYGPKTFQMMESHWPNVLNDAGSSDREVAHAKWYQSAKKIVCSRSLTQVENADLIRANLADEFEALKQKSNKDLMVFGSPRLTQELARLDLFDEYLVNVNPVLLGGGIRMFEDMPRTKLQLVSATPFKSGVVGFHYKKQK